MKADLAGEIDHMKKQAQVMVDRSSATASSGFQEFETRKYLSAMLEKEGFKIHRKYAGIPTACLATWGKASRSSRSARISTIFRKRHRSRAWRVTILLSKARRVMAKGTIPAYR